VGVVNKSGNKLDSDTVLELSKHMPGNVLVLGHVLGTHQDKHNAQCDDKTPLENKSAVGGMGFHKENKHASVRLSYDRLKKMAYETKKCNCRFISHQGVKRDARADDEASINATRHGSERERVWMTSMVHKLSIDYSCAPN
jgi:hypothetical protein